ncbi:AAA family ATPase [Cyanobium sp. FGCU-52]|nr:AAA family ATPase [Cyanobium sp. FGCU52]
MAELRRELPPWVGPVAGALVEALPRLHGTAGDARLAELITALTSALVAGETDLDLAGPPPAGLETAGWPGEHLRALEESPLARDPDGPLVLHDGRLCWRRWHERREQVLEALRRRAAASPAEDPTADPAAARRRAAAMAKQQGLDRHQAGAVRAAVERPLVLLEGGPGTGKTSTVAAMLAALELQRPGLRLQLAAPTGKAAARLQAATGGRYPCSTLHRLLESRGDRFGRDRHHPLALDALVVDEVSMVDLELMGALLQALPASCHLVLVGDPAQLPPVAPGALLLELQRPALRRALGKGVVTLTRVYRNAGAIAEAAEALRRSLTAGDGLPASAAPETDPLAGLRPLLESLPADANLQWREASPLAVPEIVQQRMRRHLEALASLADACDPASRVGAEALLAERERLLVLAPVRHGRWGLEALHRSVLGEAATAPPLTWPQGLPVLCTRNLGELGLANGDVGVLVGDGDDPQGRRLVFASPGGAPIWVHPAQLAGAAQPALALTVHKAQGSEAEEVVVLLPQREGGDRRLLYTALTRARQRALLLTPPLRDG